MIRRTKFLALVMALLLILSSSIFVYGEKGVELPMIPINPDEEPLKIPPVHRLSSDADSFAYSGDNVTFRASVTGIDDGVTKITATYKYSGGLVFNNDAKGVGFSEGWTIEASANANQLTIVVENTANDSQVNNLTFSFSFRVSGISNSNQGVDTLSVEILNKDNIAYEKVNKKANNTSFATEASIPAITNIGASLRINNTPAMRLGMTVAKDERFMKAFPSGNFAYSESSDIKFGMLIIEADKLTGELTASTVGATKEIFTTQLSSNDNEVMFVYTVNNITNYGKSYVFRPFVMFRDNGSDYQYSYGEAETRSAKQVAEMELIGETNPRKISLLNKFVK